MFIDDSDSYHCYVDLWKTPSMRINLVYQGIGNTIMIKHRVGAGNADADTKNEAIANAYGTRFCITFDYQLLQK